MDTMPAPWVPAPRITASTLTFDMVRNHYLRTLTHQPTRVTTLRLIRLHFDCFSGRDAYSLTRHEVFLWHQKIALRGTGGATKALKTLRAIYNRAIEVELFRGPNPTAGVRYFHRASRSVRLEAHEIEHFLAALDRAPLKMRAYLTLLLLTGCRPGEARTARWTDFDFSHEPAVWRKPTTKTGEPHTIPVPHQAADQLQQLPRNSVYVFPGYRLDLPWAINSPRKAWHELRRAVGLQRITLYDLRRSAASFLADRNIALPIIQATLNHKSLSATSVYVRPSLAPVREALQAQADALFPGTAAKRKRPPNDETLREQIRAMGQEAVSDALATVRPARVPAEGDNDRAV